MKHLLLLFLAIILLSGTNKAQTISSIPNGDFEEWDSLSYTDLNYPWQTTNAEDFAAHGISTAFKVPGKSGYAVRLETIISGTDTMAGSIYSFITPVTQVIDGITGYFRCHIAKGDTAFLVVEFTSGNNLMAYDYYPFTGTDTATFQYFNFKLKDSLLTKSDQMGIIAVSSNELNNIGIQPGSWLELDELTATGRGITTNPIPDGGFESWITQLVHSPHHWQTDPPEGELNEINRSTDHVSGKYSMMLTDNSFEHSINLTDGTFNLRAQRATGGAPYALQKDTLTGYFKYITTKPDSGFIALYFTKKSVGIGGASYLFHSSTSWKYFELPFDLASTPDSLLISLGSTQNPFDSLPSTLYLDDLQLKSQPHPAGIVNIPKPTFDVTAFPDPAKNQLNIRFSDIPVSGFEVKIYNTEGIVIIDKVFNPASSTITMPIDQLSSGMYFYEITYNGSEVRNKFVKAN